MSAATTRNTDTTNNAGFPPAPPEAHQKAAVEGDKMATITLKQLRAADTFQSVRTSSHAATGGKIEKVGRVNLFFGGDYMGHSLTGIKLPLVNLIGGKIRRDGVVYDVVAENKDATPAVATRDVYEPMWDDYREIARVASVAEAMDRFYKADRLNREGGTRERLIADREADYAAAGLACIASHHDSATGEVIYIRRADADLQVMACRVR